MINNLDSQIVTEGCTVPSSWNETIVSYPLHKTLHQLFEEQVNKTPTAVALTFRDQNISYAQLNTYANQLARYLQEAGAQKESLIGVCFERSFEMAIALLAVLKAGGAYVPIDPDYPDERRLLMLNDSGVSVVLTHESCITKIPAGKKVFSYEKDCAELSAFAGSNIPPTSGPQNAAYVIYTSGSTGTPKGVVNTHSGIVNRLLWMQDCFSLTSEDRVLQKTPYSFDVSVWEFFWPLITGAQLVIAEPGGHRDANYISKTIKTNAITTLHFVPSMLRLFLEADNIESLSSLKRVICSGEALPYVLQDRFFKRLSCSLFNLYGPTEAAVDVTWWECLRNDPRKIVPIGRPISNTQLYILDESMERVPVGTNGELYIGGIGVARGYLNRPELTKSRFLNDPFSGRPDGRLYKTGDLCRYLTDGAIEYLGRLDDQVKIRGFRIELGEIEAAILTHRSIRAVTVAVKGEPLSGDIRLIAYVVVDGDTLPIDELRQSLITKLPEYMIPSHFIKMSSLPTTQSGKIDKKALPDPPTLRNQLQQIFIEPSTDTEQKIAAIWAEQLRLDKVGLNDNFFDLGGNSILASIVAAAIERSLNTTLPVVKLFQHPTISSITQYIDNVENGNNDSSKMQKVQDRISMQKNAFRAQQWLNKKK